MKIAFIGFRHGHIFSLYGKCLENPEIEIAGAWEDGEEYRGSAEEQGIEFIDSDYSCFMSDPTIDAIACGYYFAGRGKIALEALSAGKHFICDKPLCTKMSELDEIERLSREKNLSVGLMLDLRYMGVIPLAKEVISSGKLGKIHSVSFGGQHCLGYSSRPKWYFEDGKHGGSINDIGIHGIDLIEYLTDTRLAKVHGARCWNAFADKEPHFLDSAQLMVELDGGIGVIGDVSYSSPYGLKYKLPHYWRTTFWGTGGIMEFSSTSDELFIAYNNSKTPEILTAKPLDYDYLTDFIDEISGKNVVFNTARNLASTRDLLTIQEFADK